MATEIDPKQLKALFPVQHEQENSETDRVQYGGCENCVTTLQHQNFPQLFTLSPITSNWTLDNFRVPFEPYHTGKSDKKQLRKNSLTCLSTYSFNCSNWHAAGHRFGAFLTLLWESCDQYAAYSNFLRLLSIVTFSLWGSNPLNVGTKDIFPSKF